MGPGWPGHLRWDAATGSESGSAGSSSAGSVTVHRPGRPCQQHSITSGHAGIMCRQHSNDDDDDDDDDRIGTNGIRPGRERGTTTGLLASGSGEQMGESRARILQRLSAREFGERDQRRGGLGARSAVELRPGAPLHGSTGQARTHRVRIVGVVRRRQSARLAEAARGDLVLLGRRGQGGAGRRVRQSSGQLWQRPARRSRSDTRHTPRPLRVVDTWS